MKTPATVVPSASSAKVRSARSHSLYRAQATRSVTPSKLRSSSSGTAGAADAAIGSNQGERFVYVLGEGGNAVELRLEEQSFGDFDVTDGYVLVAEAARGRIAGSIFIRVAFRPRAGVPQTFDPPLVIRFLLEGSAGG